MLAEWDANIVGLVGRYGKGRLSPAPHVANLSVAPCAGCLLLPRLDGELSAPLACLTAALGEVDHVLANALSAAEIELSWLLDRCCLASMTPIL
jgi:hypothetical protein